MGKTCPDPSRPKGRKSFTKNSTKSSRTVGYKDRDGGIRCIISTISQSALPRKRPGATIQAITYHVSHRNCL
jgi:hypothetical protein